MKGFALITVLAILLMIALGSAAILQSVGSHTSMKSLSVQETKDQYVAEAGMQFALWTLRTNPAAFAADTTHDVLAADGVTVLGTVHIKKTGNALCVNVGVACP